MESMVPRLQAGARLQPCRPALTTSAGIRTNGYDKNTTPNRSNLLQAQSELAPSAANLLVDLEGKINEPAAATTAISKHMYNLTETDPGLCWMVDKIQQDAKALERAYVEWREADHEERVAAA